MKRALVVVDVLNDFCEGGKFAVVGGAKVAQSIKDMLDNEEFDLKIAVKEVHPKDHISFKEFPEHCIEGSEGAELKLPLVDDDFDVIVLKGMQKDVDSFSGFRDNNGGNETELTELLKDMDEIVFCGIAGDICVYHTVKDAVELLKGKDISITPRLIASVDDERFKTLFEDLVLNKNVNIYL